MNLDSAPTPASARLLAHAAPRRRLILMRVAWVLMAVLIMLLIAAGIPFEYAYYKSICMGAACATETLSALFPDGRFVPPWTRWLAAGPSVWWVAIIFFPDLPLNFNGPAFFVFLAGPVVVQVYRYRRVSTSAQRQQTKWVVYGFSVAIVGFL